VVSLAEVLRQYWPQYERRFGSALLPSHRRAVQAILSCRTSALGGQVFRCADCRRDHFVYHSCNHRACPQCGQADAAQWVQQQKLKLLPIPYYLITFTVPEALRSWLRSHQKHGYALLLRESAATLQDVAARPKYLGAELGILSVLHTWGRQLQFHPHVHCVLPAGGLRPDGLRWCRPPATDFFLPQKVLAARFRNRLKAALSQAPDAVDIPVGVWRQEWVVDVQPAGSGQTAIKYLAAYVYHTALGSQRILNADHGRVTFKYKDSADQQWRVLLLSATEFLRRFLQHILPKGFQRVRYFGWLAPAAKARSQRILALLDWTPPPKQPLPARPLPICPCCQNTLTLVGHFARPPPRRP
jgi:hypothetical protein